MVLLMGRELLVRGMEVCLNPDSHFNEKSLEFELMEGSINNFFFNNNSLFQYQNWRYRRRARSKRTE